MAACKGCKRSITKAEEAKRIEARKQADGSVAVFGVAIGIPPLKEAKGKLVGVYHYKCYYVQEKHKQMGPTGKYKAESPTAYEEAARYKTRDDLSGSVQERAQRAAARLAELLARQSALQVLEKDAAVRQELLDLESLLVEADAEAKLTQRQAEIAAEREKEETPRGWDDWREPTTVEF